MKKIVKRTIPECVVEETVYTCDICLTAEAPVARHIRTCHFCKRHSCTDHGRFDPEDYGDYPAFFCQTCYDIRYIKYADAYQKLKDDYELATGQLDEKVLEEINLNLKP